MPTKTLKSKPLFRTAPFKRADIDEQQRTVELAFSSEEEVEQWFGREILDHSPQSIRLGRLSDGGPVLVDHDRRDHVGVIESVSIDGDRRGRAAVRFGQSARASEIWQDVVDGIRKSISVGYRIHKAVLEETGDEGETFRITDWEPFEISLVSIPADTRVGVGRTAPDGDEAEFEIHRPDTETRSMAETAQQTPAPPKPHNPAELDNARKQAAEEARKTETERVQTLLSLGERHGAGDLAREFMNNGRSVDEFRGALLDRMGERGAKPIDAVPPVDVDLDEREHKRYSVVRALQAAATGDWRKAGFERELSEEIGKKLGRGSEGFFVPTSLRMGGQTQQGRRDAQVTDPMNLGGATVDTELMSMIELLRNRMMVRRLGAQVLSGLQGDLSFPRQTGTNTLYWTGEAPGTDVAEGNATFDQVPMDPKTAQATTGFSRQLLAQSSIDVEQFVRNDLIQINSLGLDRAAIGGSGTGNEPTGILNTTGIGAVVGGTDGAVPSWSNVVTLETEVAVDNADMGTLAYLTNAKVRGKLKETEKAANTAMFIWNDGDEPGMGMLNGYRAAVSNQVPSDLDKGTSTGVASAIIYGNWADLMIGEWGAIELIVDPYALKKQGLIEVTSIMMVDVAVRHAQSFAAMKDALTS